MSLHTAFARGGPALEAGGRVGLEADEARHLQALRAAPGDRLLVTDGRGALWLARLERLERREAACTLLETREPPPGLPAELAFAVANKDRTLWLVEKAVELGARVLQPVEFARSRSVADAARSAGFWRKARRRAVAALKQCGGARLPEIRPVAELPVYLRTVGASEPGAPRLLATAAARRPLGSALGDWDGTSRVLVLVGPEGGLEAEEVATCQDAGFRAVSLGDRVLRFETAAVAALAGVAQVALARQDEAGR